MAITVTGPAISTASSSNTTSYASASFIPNAGDWLVVFVVATGTLVAGTMTDSLGLGFTLIKWETYNTVASPADSIYCFVANKLASHTSMTVTFDCTGDAASGCSIYVARISGMEGAPGYWKQIKSAKGNGPGTPAVTMDTAFNTNNCGIACVGNGANPTSLTAPTGWTTTNGVDTGYNTPTTGQESVNITSGETGTTITWGSSSSTNWGAIVLEIYVAGQGPSEAQCPGCVGIISAL